MKIYKYLSQESTIKTLENQSVLLRSPTEYNDPFDCLFYVDEKEKEEAYKLFINYQLFKNLYEMFVADGTKASKPSAYAKTLILNIKQTAEIIKKTKYYKFQPDIVMYQALVAKIKNKEFPNYRHQFNKMVEETMPKIRETAIVSCFSLDCENILMWSHYGEKHKGACIEYEVSDDGVFERVSYSETLPVFKLKKVMGYVFGHKFIHEKVDANEKLNKLIFEPLLTKTLEWEYEKEVRCVFSKNEQNDRIHRDGKMFFLEMPKPTKVFLGCESSDAFAAQVKEVAGDAPVIKVNKFPGRIKVS